MILEAAKMDNINADRDGKVIEIKVQKGDLYWKKSWSLAVIG